MGERGGLTVTRLVVCGVVRTRRGGVGVEICVIVSMFGRVPGVGLLGRMGLRNRSGCVGAGASDTSGGDNFVPP